MNQKNTTGSFPPEAMLRPMHFLTHFSSPDGFTTDLQTLCQTLNDVFLQLKKALMTIENTLHQTNDIYERQRMLFLQAQYKKVLLRCQRQLLKQIVAHLPLLLGETT